MQKDRIEKFNNFMFYLALRWRAAVDKSFLFVIVEFPAS